MHNYSGLNSVVVSLFSIGNVQSEAIEFVTGRGFFITMLIMAIYGTIYNLLIRRAVTRDERSREYGHRFVFKLFWERLRRFEIFTVIFVLVCLTFVALPFVAISRSKGIY
jgi:hypothetical protein